MNKKSKKPAFKFPRINRNVVLVILLVILSVAGGFAGGYFGAGGNNSRSTQRTVVSNESNLVNDIAKEVGPSVVSIDVETTQVSNTFFGPQTYSQQSAGTGVIVSSGGLVVTNRHVVPKGVQKVAVTLSDGTKLSDVSVVGRTPDSDTLDLAFLKINDTKGKKLVPARLGDSSSVKVGDKVVAIGNALGQFQNTVTSGIISGYGRNLQAGDQSGDATENLQDLFQTDAAINQGNSGGPLVNVNGEVIGINTAIAGDAQNIGFAIPINDLKGLISGVLKNGKLERPYLGVRYVSINSDYAYQYNLSVDRGAYLAPNSNGDPAVIPGSPAEKAGLKEKDIITRVNSTDIDARNGLSAVLGRYSVGTQVGLTVIRGGKTMQINATLGSAPKS
ncbi:MAG TPA: trypsin-like peptidase domain-containing protein [Candidatus Saccharimonadales bacterium]|nr:trypsin-like peptidase domain-containing protein [Candidatus Saccharimonadales bacterium]